MRNMIEKIESAFRERQKTYENIAKENALKSIIGPKNEQELYRVEAREWFFRSRAVEECLEMAISILSKK